MSILNFREENFQIKIRHIKNKIKNHTITQNNLTPEVR